MSPRLEAAGGRSREAVARSAKAGNTVKDTCRLLFVRQRIYYGGMSTVSIEFRGKYYSCQEAAELLDLDPNTVRNYCNGDPPRLAGEKVGRDWFIPKAEIDRYNRDRRDPGRPPAQ